MTTKNLTYRPTRRKHLLMLALTLLSLAATLPIAAQVIYSDLDKLQHLEKIEVTTDGGNNSAKLTLPINVSTGNANLLDGDKSTSWQSWIQRKLTEEKLVNEQYSGSTSITDIYVVDGEKGKGPEAVEYEVDADGNVNYYLTTKAINGLGSFRIFNGVDNYVDYSRSNKNISFTIRLKGSKAGDILFYGGDTYNGNPEQTGKVGLHLTGEIQEEEITITTADLVHGSKGWLAIDASQYDGDITVYSLRNFKTGGILLTNWGNYIDKTEYGLNEDAKTYEITGNNNCTLSIGDGPLRITRNNTYNNLGSFNVHNDLNFGSGHNSFSFDIKIYGTETATLNIIVQDADGNYDTKTLALPDNDGADPIPISFDTSKVRGASRIWINADNYQGNITVSSITNVKVNDASIAALNISSYSGDVSLYKIDGQNNDVSIADGKLIINRTERGLGYLNVLDGIDFRNVQSKISFKIRIKGTLPGHLNIYGVGQTEIVENDETKTIDKLLGYQGLELDGSIQDFDVTLTRNGNFTTNRGEICIDAASYTGDLIISSITDFKIDEVRHPEFDKEFYTESDLTKYTLNWQNYTMSQGGGRLIATCVDNTPSTDAKAFHFALAKDLTLDPNAKFRVRIRLRGDSEGSVLATVNNTHHTSISFSTSWEEREVIIPYGDGGWGPIDWIGLFAGWTPYSGKLDIDWVEVTQINTDGYTNSAETTGTAIVTQHFKDWATTTDEDGKVHIPNAYKYEGYDPVYSNEDTSEDTAEDHKGYITFKDDGTGNDPNNYNIWKNFALLTGLTIEKGKSYRVEVEVKGNKSGSFRLALGITNPWSWIDTDLINFTTDWQVHSVEINPNDIFNKEGVNIDKTENAILNCNFGWLTANLQFRTIRVLELPATTETQEDLVDLSGGTWPFAQAGKVIVENGVGIIKHIDAEGKKFDNQQVSIYHGTFKKGRKYTLKAKMKCEGEDLDLTYYQQYQRLKTGWNDDVFGYFDKKLIDGEDFVEVSLPIGPYITDVTNFINFFHYGWDKEGNILYIKDMVLESSTEDENNQYFDYTALKPEDDLYNDLSDTNDGKTSFEYINGENVLYCESTKKGVKALLNLTLKPQTNYRVKVHLNNAATGDFNIKLGDDTYLQRQTVSIDKIGWQTIEADFYDFNINGNGYCVIEPGSSMTGDITVDWVEIMEVDPAVTDDSEMGYNYFDLTLPEAPQKDDVYYVYVRRGASGAPAGAAPMRFRVATINEGGGNEVQQGEYALGGYSEMSKALHKENAYDQNVGINQFVRVEILNAANGGKTLRLYCTRNASDHNVIMQTKDASNNVTNVEVPALEFTEVGLYKLIPWKNVNSNIGANWVMPLISRFQIEANGVRGNYPGEDLETAVKNFEKSRYTNPGATLFDGDANSEWQLNGESQRVKNDFYIDLLLPQLHKDEGNNGIHGALSSGGLLKNGYINMVVQFTRPRNAKLNFPMEIKYCGLTEDNPTGTTTDWKTLILPLIDAEGDILFSLDVDPSWKRVRIQSASCINGNSNENTTDKNFALAEIRAYLEMPKINLDEFDYSVLYNDRLFDFRKSDRGDGISGLKLSTFAWEHTKGITDEINDPVPYYVRKTKDKLNQEVNRNASLYTVADRWAGNWTETFINKVNGSDIGTSANNIAKNKFITGTVHDDSDGLNETESSKVVGDRQATYVVTHDIYTLPGKRVDLYPYSDIHSTSYYEDKFVRWYDYQTDGTPDYLYFFTDPKSVIKTASNGYYGSSILLDPINRGPGTVGSVYFGQKDLVDGKVPDKWIAADFTICLVDSNFVYKTQDGITDKLDNFRERFGFTFDNTSKNIVNNNNKKIKEPTITYRHLFHIKDASKFAEDFSKDYETNVEYNRKHRRYISARAGADFTIRLDYAMPLGSEYDLDNGDNASKSSYFYKRKKAGTNEFEYVRVCSYDIEAYDASKFMTYAGSLDASNYASYALKETVQILGADGKPTGQTKEVGIFTPYDKSFYTNVGAIISTTLADSADGVDWVSDNRGFARAIYCKGKNAKAGKYLVRLYGKDKNGDIITLCDDSNKPLIVAEYEVTFLPESEASFVPEHRLKNLNPSNVLYTHTEDYLEHTFNSDPNVPTRRAVNFDRFSLSNLATLKESTEENAGALFTDDELKSIIYKVENVQLSTTEGEYTGGGADKFEEKMAEGLQSGNYLKMPLDWTVSNYGFGYDLVGDYNIFRLADHSSATVYHSAATRREASTNPVDSTINASSPQRGVYDRLFYNTNGGQKGMFYYVNAASDPGDMVEIEIDDPCPGSTLYVSGWVNEFNDHQRETANIIVNYYANITEDLNANGTVKENAKVTRRVQMRGFETGYVPNYSNSMGVVHRDGKQGDWMHFYFSFVPNIQRVKETLEQNEAILNYSLVLENNAISSWGADYAIDDIRAYVAPPRVEAYQAKPICNSKATDENLQVEIRLPYDALMESLGINEPQNATDGAYKSIQYAILDKEKYDEEYNNAYESSTDPTNSIANIQRTAFAKSVLHYPHMHLDTDAAQVEANKTKQIPWGTIYFNTYYDGNLEWEEGNYKGDPAPGTGVPANRAMKHDEYGERNISFISTPPMDSKKRDYIIVIGQFDNNDVFGIGTGNNVTNYTLSAVNDITIAEAFKVGTSCCQMASFTLNKAAQKVVDGILYGDDDQITCCENQRPVVQLNLYRKEKGENKNILDPINPNDNNYSPDDYYKFWENPYLDWYAGTYEDFMKAEMTVGETKTSLWEVLAYFRDDYPTSTTWDVPASGEEGTDASITKYTKGMKEYLKGLYEQGKLQLYQASYVFPNLKLDRDEYGNLIKDDKGYEINYKDFYVTAVPIDSENELTTKEYIVCVEPTEVKITVSNTSPHMNNGFASGITYPAGMDIVPLRLGLKHTDKSSTTNGTQWTVPANTEVKDNINLGTYLTTYYNTETLTMPLRGLHFATTGVNTFKTVEGDPFCYLAETNDPYYRKLGQVEYKNPNKAPSASSSGNGGVATQADEEPGDNSGTGDNGTNSVNNYDSDFGLVPRGKISLEAENNGTFNNVKITFNDTDMKFHEGYFYTFKFPYEEDYTGVTLNGIDEESMPCHGETYFTIKVVPEYQIWTGDSSLNWNNDDNWRRVQLSDLLATGTTPNGKGTDTRFTYAGSNDTEFSYAPLDFTKVIIPAGTSYPQLAARRHSNTATGAATDAATITVANGNTSATGSYVWTDFAPKAATAIYGTESVDADANGVAASSYHPTLNIQYDMAAVTYDGNNNVYCRPWYANACDEIHFDSNAEILNQQNLDYQKAWVDMEMTPHRWYTVASPLYGVVAGDMYLPKADGRQNTELFKDIEYSTTINDRFQPAVYQRGWDKGSETVYTIHDNITTDTETVALASTWSHVYNDVTEEYAPGAGYSVKTDVTRLDKFQPTTTTEGEETTMKPAAQTYVKFRFPKADTSYNYFTDGNSNVGETNHRDLNRTKEGKLFEGTATTVTLTKKNSGKLFLVGNPFMAHLDMAAFLTANSSVIEPKFWLLTETEQVAASMTGTDLESLITNMTERNATNLSQLPPMQGFFVEATSAVKELTINFTPAMMAVQPYTATDGTPILKAPAASQNAKRATQNEQRRAELSNDIIRVSTEESMAIIRLAPEAQKDYVASEDVEMIDDSNQKSIRRIYTVAGTMASAINQTPDADGVEVGLMAPTDSVTVVTFKGLALEDYMLYDTTTGEKTQLYDGFELEMTGSVSGRYFLTSGIDTAEIEDGTIRIRPIGHEVVVTAPAVCGELTVRVFDTLGREVAKADGFDEEVRIALDPGIYAVEVVGAETGRKSAKLQIR